MNEPVGQCGEYANLMTYYANAIGISANTRILLNAQENSSGIVEGYLWVLSESLPQIQWVNLWSNSLRTCDGSTANWIFLYHAVCNSGGNHGDPVFNIVAPASDYDLWWRYYLHPHPVGSPPYDFSHEEPPPFAPFYYDWSRFTPQNVIPSYRSVEFPFSHP